MTPRARAQQERGDHDRREERQSDGGGARATAANGGHRRESAWRSERRIVLQDAPLQFSQLRSELETQLIEQPLPRGLEDLQRVGLTTCAVQRQHQGRQQPLPEWVCADQLLELGDELRSSA